MKHKINFTLISKQRFILARSTIPSMVIQINTFPCKDRWVFGNFVVEDRNKNLKVYFLKSRISENLVDNIE